MRWIDEMTIQKGARVLMRVDFNIPMENGMLTDTFRVDAVLPTLFYLHEKGARTTLITHLSSETQNMEPLDAYLAKKCPFYGESLVLDAHNVRSDPREKENDESYARELAEGFDLFVQDAFAVCHREHASVVGIPKVLPSAGGLLLKKEIEELTKARTPESPSLAIVGGAKFTTKEPLIRELLTHYDTVHITGALANDFFAAKGIEVGVSKLGEDTVNEAVLNNEHVVLPEVIETENLLGEKERKAPEQTKADEKILDAFAPAYIFDDIKTVLWNGPAGYYEGGFVEGTQDIARALAQLARGGVQVIIGGGDTLAATKELGIREQFTHVSTGGGAMLEFLLNGTLTGIEALRAGVSG